MEKSEEFEPSFAATVKTLNQVLLVDRANPNKWMQTEAGGKVPSCWRSVLAVNQLWGSIFTEPAGTP